MFTIKAIIILTVLSLLMYLGNGLLKFILMGMGLRGGSLLKKWSERVTEGKPGTLDVHFGAGSEAKPS